MTSRRKANSDNAVSSKLGPGEGTSTTVKLAKTAGSAAISTFHALNDAEPLYVPGSPYSTIRHTRPWVYYRGVSTTVPISILGSYPLSSGRRVSLQRRGWRTGLLGWTLGGFLGGNVGKELDVTPQQKGSWESDVDSRRRQQYDKEVNDFLSSSVAPNDHKILETDLIHIPVSSGDGYFRILIYPFKSATTAVASTASFRVGSLSLSSAHPRGSSVMTLVPELLLKSGSVVASTAAWGSFYAAFPLLKVAQMMPGSSSWGNWAMNRAYKLAGGEGTTRELKERYKVEERRERAEQSVYKNVRSIYIQWWLILTDSY